MDKNLLDNMSGQELKEMIDNAEITLEELDNTALEKIMNFEIDMLCFGTGDMNTVHRCSELLNERNNVKKLGEEEIISIIGKAQNEHVIIVDKESTESKAPVIKKRNVILRRIGLVAAVLTTLIITTGLVAAAFGVNIFECIANIVRQEEHTKIDIEGFTFYNGGEAKNYSSIEEMMEEKKWDIMYPTVFPENVTVDKIMLNKSSRGNDRISIITNDKKTRILIEKNAPNEDDWDEHQSFYKSNGIKYYIYTNNDSYFAVTYYKGDYYSIQANDYDDLILIINNFKE